MNSFSLAVGSIRSQPLPSILSVLATAAGITILCAVFLFASALETGFRKNAQNIDLVAGVKGSPLQMILSSVYHVDVPAGNMTRENAEKLQKHRNIKKIIPVAMGDTYRGFRIIGSIPDYISIYGGEIAHGSMFDHPFEAVAGAQTNLEIGTEFVAMHGLSGEDGDHHNDRYRITGILKPTGTVLDRLIVTSIGGVQKSHEYHNHGEDNHSAKDEDGITALLIQVRNPTAIMNLPREINESTNIMAASPSYVMARFSQDLGLGKKSLFIIGTSFLVLSVLVILTMLAAKLETRKYDLAVLRVLGASPWKMASIVILEGILLALVGTIAGLIAGHGLAYAALETFGGLKSIMDPSFFLMPSMIDGMLLLCGLLCGFLGGILPMVLALRTDVTNLLSRGRV